MGWRFLIPHEDKVDVISPINILFWGGGEFWSLMKIKLMLLPHSTLVIGGSEFWSLMKIELMCLSQSTYCSEGVANFDPSWRQSWCYYPNQRIVQTRWQMLIPHEDRVDVIIPINVLFRGGGEVWSLMKITLMLLSQSTYCSEEVIPHEDRVDVIIPINVLFRGGGEPWSLMKIKLMLLSQSTYCSEGVANPDPSWR